MKDDSTSEVPQASGYQFGWFKGVYTPSVLTVLGIVMYLRFGWVLGNVGLKATLLIVAMSCAITFLTGLSLSALATNMKVGGGGSYYIISRSLGLETGAAIGVPLYAAQAIGIGFYAVGFAEAVIAINPALSIPVVATIMLLVLAVVAALSADLALRFQFVVMALVALSLVSLFAGAWSPVEIAPAVGPVPKELGFWTVFAVFFPAVTGIEAGIAMSGDLKNPAKALPLGTIGAVVTGFVVYLAVPIYLSHMVADAAVLRTDTFIAMSVARWGPLIVAGVWAAALSSAMGVLLGAPRILQALAKDGVLPRFIGRGYGKGKNPRIATVISLAIALSAVWLGDLNAIAPILTMFFLTSYGLLNLSAGLEELIGSPSWNPKIRFHAAVSLVGAFACVATMFMVNAGATFIAAAVTFSVYALMKRRSIKAHWGDMRYGLLMLQARSAIQKLANKKPDARSWRPNILVLSGSPTARWHLVELANAVGRGDGCLTVATIIPPNLWSAEKEDSLTESIRSYLMKREISALVKVLPAIDVVTGAESLVRAYGFGPIVPNTVLLGDTGRAENYSRFAKLIHLVYKTRRNIVLVREGEGQDAERREQVDIWWRGDQTNIGFMLAMALLLKRSSPWANAQVTIKTVATSDESADEARARLQTLVESHRLDLEQEVVRADDGDVFKAIRDSSWRTDLVLIGMRPPSDEVDTDKEYGEYYQKLLDSTEGMPTTALVLAAEGIEFDRMLGME